MRNAKEEFKRHIEGSPRVVAVEIGREHYSSENCFEVLLKTNHSEDDYLKFLDTLNFSYDSGYGGQELYGTIWYEDGSWSERGEYDSSEWWEYKKTPVIPNKLQNEKD